MTSRGTVESRDRFRLFLGLPLPLETRDRLVEWQRAHLAGVADTRVVPPANLHITLAFLGSRPVGDVDEIIEAMHQSAAETKPLALSALGYRETRSVGMLVLADEDSRATRLAAALAERLERLGVYEPERRPWLPHVTVLRFRRPPRLTVEPAELGTFSPSEVALYHSVLRPTGAQYDIRESVALGG